MLSTSSHCRVVISLSNRSLRLTVLIEMPFSDDSCSLRCSVLSYIIYVIIYVVFNSQCFDFKCQHEWCNFNRFVGLKKPGGNVFLPKHATLLIAFIWLSMMAISSPYAAWGEIIYYPPYNVYGCFTGATLEPSILSHYLIAGRTISYVIPLFIIWMAYIGIAYSTWSSVKKVTTYVFGA